MPAELKRLLRALALFWARLGSLQIYFVALLGLVLALAAFGLWHLVAPRKDLAPPAPVAPAATPTARVSPGVAPSPSRPAVRDGSPTPSATPELGRAIAITDIKETMRRGMRGETLVVAEIGMTPQTTAEKEKVEIDVSFFDLDRDNQMHPTDAQITYQWLTPERDWTDPAPKYLAATYLQRRPFRRGSEQLRYGGFIVRIYSDGQLQDQRSKPENLIANVPRNLPAPTPPPSRRSVDEGWTPAPSSSPADLSRRSLDEGGSRSSQPPTLNSQPAETPTDHRSPTTDHAPDSLPKGIVVPGKPGFVQSPYDPKFIIDVRGFPPGTLVNDPNTNKPFKVP